MATTSGWCASHHSAFTRGITAIHNKSPANGIQSHTGTVDAASLPSAAKILSGHIRRTVRKAPSTVNYFFKNANSILYFRTVQLSLRVFFHIRVSSYLICTCFFTDAIITYGIQKSIVWMVNIYALFCIFLDIFYIFYDYFCLFFNDFIFFADIFLPCLIYFLKLYWFWNTFVFPVLTVGNWLLIITYWYPVICVH